MKISRIIFLALTFISIHQMMTYCLSIDLLGNLTQRNKQTNSYSDALDLIDKHSMLELVQIDEQTVIVGLLKAFKANPIATWYLELSFGDKGSFKYQVKPSLENGSVFFEIASV